MRIKHFIYDSFNNPWLDGGQASRTHEIYRRLNNNNEITVYSGRYPYLPKEKKLENIRYKFLGWPSSNFILNKISFSLESMNYSNDCDLLVKDVSAFSPFFPKKTDIPTVCSICNIYENHALAYGPVGIIAKFYEKIYPKFYDNYIVVSEDIKNKICQVRKGKKTNIKVIPNGVDKTLLNLKRSEKDYILYIGRLDIYQKGLDVLIDAFAKIKDKTDLNLIIIGDGLQKYKLEKMIKQMKLEQRIRMVGRMNGDKKLSFISNSMFLCCPSRFEGDPIVSLESFACGKPIIASSAITNASSERSIILKNLNSNNLAKKILLLSENKKLRKKLGDSARTFARQLTWDKIALNQQIFYEQIIKY